MTASSRYVVRYIARPAVRIGFACPVPGAKQDADRRRWKVRETLVKTATTGAADKTQTLSSGQRGRRRHSAMIVPVPSGRANRSHFFAALSAPRFIGALHQWLVRFWNKGFRSRQCDSLTAM